MKARPTRGEEDLIAELWDPYLADDWRKLVQTLFPWGEADTPLHNIREPRKWQIEYLEEVTDFIRDQKIREATGQPLEVFRAITSSGRGTGKTALEMMLILCFLTTRVGGTVIVTANNEDQLKTRTWSELGVWHTLAINTHWFERSTLTLVPAEWLKQRITEQLKIDCGYYYCAGQLWDKDRPEAFAGIHNRYGLMVNFQEAIGIPPAIWTVTNGFFSDPTKDRFWTAGLNPRKNTGAAYECFHKDRLQWRTRIIDSRTVEGVDVKLANEVIEKHGLHSPEACAEVTGEFPGESEKQYISRALINESAARELPPYDAGAPTVIGVDVARQGGDRTAIKVRKGRDARTFPTIVLRGANNHVVALRVIEVFEDLVQRLQYRPIINVDVGAGAGVIDILRARGYKVNEVDFGSTPDNPAKYRNKRAEMYGLAKEWLKGGCLEDLRDLKDDLAGPEYKWTDSGDGSAIILESKDQMRARGLASPDLGDAFVLTFAVKIAREDQYDHFSGRNGAPRQRVAAGVGDDWNPFDN